MPKTIDIIAAARPNFMKAAPLWHALDKEPWARPRIIHTGQHYDYAMSEVFFEELGLPKPHVNLGIGGGTHGAQTGQVLQAYEAHLLQDRPDFVVVIGDVNATPAAAMAAVKLGITTAHLEAGLRSFDRRMPEEINRIVTDAICDVLWTPSEDADANLLREGALPEKIIRVGNIMIDTLEMLLPRIRNAAVPDGFSLPENGYAVVTLHRPSNVDNAQRLHELYDRLADCAQVIPLIFPMHPRTRANMETFGLLPVLKKNPRILLLPPQPYLAFMHLVSKASAVITDSGGIQEETSYLGIPCLTLRENTERPVTVTLGTNILVTATELPERLRHSAETTKKQTAIPLWDGSAAKRTTAYLRDRLS